MKFRRAGIVVLLFSLIWSVYKINTEKSPQINSKPCVIEGRVSNITRSKKCKQYYMGSYLASDMSSKDRNIMIGDKVRVFGKLNDLDNFYIGDFNYGLHLKSKGISHNIKVEKIEIVGKDRLYSILGAFKEGFLQTNNYLYKENADFLNAITIGVKDNLSKDIRDIFADSGSSHIMAISGLHISIILSMLIFLFGSIRNIKTILIIAGILFLYSLLLGGGASIYRAIELSILSMMAFLIDERVDVINLISIIASLMIIENPYIIYNPSFELSFLAVLSIFIFNKYIKKYVYLNILSVTISSNILTLPIVAYLFKEVSTVSIIGNIAVIPFIGIIIFLDFLSVLFYFIFSPLGLMLAFLNSSIIEAVLFLLKKIANFGVNNIIFKNITLKQICLYYVFIFLFSILLEIYMIRKNKI